jgi:acyl carrier protein phosphodiesterase
MLHRKIDFYTDNHPEFIKSRERLYEKYHKYAGVIMDVFYDHFLAKNWDKYSELSLNSFTSYSYGILLKNYLILPKRTKKILPILILNNWLSSYKDFSGLRKTFNVISKRTAFKTNFNSVVDDLIVDYDKYEEEFNIFFPDIAEFVEIQLNILYPDTTEKNIIIKKKQLIDSNISGKKKRKWYFFFSKRL